MELKVGVLKSSSPAESSSFPFIEGKESDFRYRVALNMQRIRSSTVEIWRGQEKFEGHLDVRFPLLSQKRFIKAIRNQKASFQFKLEKDPLFKDDHFIVAVDSEEFQESAKRYESGLSSELYSETSSVIIRNQADSCLDPIDGKEKQRFLLSIVKRAKIGEANRKAVIAATNAIEILVRSRFSFGREDLSGLAIPYAQLDEGMFWGANLQGSDLSRASIRRAFLREADLRNTKVEKVKTGLLKKLNAQGVKGISYAESTSILVAWSDEELIVCGLIRGKEEVLFKITKDQMQGLSVSNARIAPDGKSVLVTCDRKQTVFLDIFDFQSKDVLMGEYASELYFSKDSKHFAICAYRLGIVLGKGGVETGTKVLSKSKGASQIRFSSEGAYLAAVVSGRQEGDSVVRIWNLKNIEANPEPVYEFTLIGVKGEACRIEFSLQEPTRLYIYTPLIEGLCYKNRYLLVDIQDQNIVWDASFKGRVLKSLVSLEDSLLSVERGGIYQIYKDGVRSILIEASPGEEILCSIYSPTRSQVTYLTRAPRMSSPFLCRYDMSQRRNIMRISLKSMLTFELDLYNLEWGNEGDTLYLIDSEEQIVTIDVTKLGDGVEAKSAYIYAATITSDNRFLAVWSFTEINLFSLESGVFSRTIKLPFHPFQKSFLDGLSYYFPESVSSRRLREALMRIMEIHSLNPDSDSLSASDLNSEFLCMDSEKFAAINAYDDLGDNNRVYDAIQALMVQNGISIGVVDDEEKIFRGIYKVRSGRLVEEEIELLEGFERENENIIDYSFNQDFTRLVTLSEIPDYRYKQPSRFRSENAVGNVLRVWDVEKTQIIAQADNLPRCKEAGKKESIGISEDGKFVFVAEDEEVITTWKLEEQYSGYNLKPLWRYPYQFTTRDALISSNVVPEVEEKVLQIFESYGAKRA